ncbi:hypothetical protein BJ165DRAFT_1358385 [Panaeolus papilionaceus]|nr:hypothetical protein BJ165DRAFT_1358385 [Panaeolus papilionaceus]
MPITTPPSRKSKPLPPPDPPPPISNSLPPSSMPPSQPTTVAAEPTSTDGIDCICAINIDDGYSVACDECGRWCHMACFNFPPSGQGQNAASDIEFRCWRCEPRSPGMAVRAREIMKGKMAARGGGGGGGGAIVASTSGGGEGGDGRRRSPVGSEHVEIDEPWNQAYVHIREDIVTDDETRQKLRLHAKNWRGITALVEDPSSSSPQPASSSSPILNSTTKLKPIPQNIISAQPLLSPSYTSSHPSILPPSYALHTTTPLPSNSLIIPLKSRISTSTSYLRDPLNSYAHLGMPRPFVHLMGPPLDLSLDGRCVGNEARWVRSGCVPNAVLKPVLCREGKARRRKGKVEMGKEKAGDEDDTTLGFALFATRDLKANEEVVLGWEWDDGNVVHLLPALMDAPGMFRSVLSFSLNLFS